MTSALENSLRKSEGVKRALCFMGRTVMNGIPYTKHGDHLTSLVILRDRGHVFSIKWWATHQAPGKEALHDGMGAMGWDGRGMGWVRKMHTVVESVWLSWQK